ncbi:MAG: hypothetical protein JWO36_2298 [Myxococcales bacterium]|nr:hypothetical protein [Myxococcales bacterium]
MFHRFAFCVVLIAACSEPPHALPDGGVIPRNPYGTFAVTSGLDFGSPPGTAATLVSGLLAMTDGPDDPSRYIIDRLVESMPDGTAKTAARALAPFVAAYLNVRVMAIAPHFVDGVRSISNGLDGIARHVTTLETLRIAADGTTRTIDGIRFQVGPKPIDISWTGSAGASLTTTLDAQGRLAFSEHAMSFAYGRMLRTGLELAVIPSVDPAAHDLSQALRDLVDCAQLGKLVSDKVGLGSPALYEAACATGMTAAASDFYARLATLDGSLLQLHMRGAAHAHDLDGSGTMDTFDTGDWKGTVGYGEAQTALGPTVFTGTRE